MEFLGQVALEIRHEGMEDVPKTFRVIRTLLLFSSLLNFISRIHNSKIADAIEFRFCQATLCLT